jgi:hypothetical protein
VIFFALPRPALPRPANPCRAFPRQAEQRPAAWNFPGDPSPDQFSPVRRDDAVAESLADHPAVSWVESQNVAPPTKRAEIVVLVRPELAAFNVINMARLKQHDGVTVHAPFCVAFPDS